MSPEKLKPQRQWWDQRLGFKDTFSYQKCCWSDLLFISYFEGSLGRKYVKITSVTNFGEDAPGVSTVWFFSRTNALVRLPEPMNFRFKIFKQTSNEKSRKSAKRRYILSAVRFKCNPWSFSSNRIFFWHSWQRPRLFKRWMALSTG